MPEFLKSPVVRVVFAVVAMAVVVAGALVVLRPPSISAVAGANAVPIPVATPSVGPTAFQEATAIAATPTPSPSSSSPSASATASSTPTSASCTNFTGDMVSPARFVVERMGVDSPMTVVGKDADGNPGAPPRSEAYTTAWYNRSPAPGTNRGNVILTIHTYSKGQALGNQLYGKNGLSDGTEGLRVGDLIKISDDQGNQVCYRYSGNSKVWVQTYDPDSGVFHNLDGPPQLAIMICWDHVAATDDWDSRIIFYASLIPKGTPV